MIDNYRYGVLPYEIQIIILKMGLEHPLSSIIKKTIKNLPEPIFEKSSFFELYFLFHINLNFFWSYDRFLKKLNLEN